MVELRIKEGGSTFEEGKEITFDYNASFFLYASLEQNRKIAPGRMQGQPNPPILTGVPASGMAYLDRPTAAGYFIFPDLSVRHEGQYRLSFSLFETTKEEKDFDMEPSAAADNSLPAGVDWRMEIKTAPFDVFSAKKFPGLMESTPLSKEVADQGCRVRIRREVRMRKREGKSNRHERREEDFSRRRTVTPASSEDPHAAAAAAAAAARARSMSNSSEQCMPYAGEPRRPSGVDAYPPPPPQPSYEHANRGHLAFGDPNASHYAAPRQYNHQSHPSHQPHPPHQPHQPHQSHQSHQPLAPMSPARRYTAQSQYIKPEPQSYPYQATRSVPPPCPSPSVYSSDGHVRRDSHPSYPPTPTSAHPSVRGPGPIQSQRPGLKIENLLLPPLEPQTEPIVEPAPVPTGGKRKHDIVFAQSSQALHNRERQVDPHHGGGHRMRSPEPDTGLVKRADGSVEAVRFNKFL